MTHSTSKIKTASVFDNFLLHIHQPISLRKIAVQCGNKSTRTAELIIIFPTEVTFPAAILFLGKNMSRNEDMGHAQTKCTHVKACKRQTVRSHLKLITPVFFPPS